MKTAKILSREQVRAKNVYDTALVPAMIVSTVLFTALWTAFFLLLNWLHIYEGTANPGGFMLLAFIPALLWTRGKVRRSGLSLESRQVETVQKTATVFSGEIVQWRTVPSRLGKFGDAIAPFLMSATAWGVWRFGDDFLIQGLGAATCPAFLVFGILGLVFIRSPHVSIDEKGIILFQRGVRRTLPWEKVSRCEVVRATNYLGEAISNSLIFKDANGKVRLYLSYGVDQEWAVNQFEEIATEVKRRLTGQETDSTRL